MRVRVGFREDLRVRDMMRVVRVAPGAGGALGVDFGYGGCGGWGSLGRVNFWDAYDVSICQIGMCKEGGRGPTRTGILVGKIFGSKT